jgi:predicted DNA-binding transcriptional regulator AlpA
MLKLERTADCLANVAATDRRGRLMSAREIAAEIFCGSRSEQWVKRHVAPQYKLRLGHSTVRWWEVHVREWIDRQRAAA